MRVSISKIKLFKACRRAYELKYVYGLEPVEKAEALQTGSSYHKLLETLLTVGDLYAVEEDYSKEQAMASAYWKYIFPQFKVNVCEKWFEKNLNGNRIVGIVDGIAEDGVLVEHKTTSMDTFEYELGLERDEQILMYMWLTGKRKMWYTVCRKPTIRQKKNESDEEFFHRMVEWYDEDTDSKIRTFPVVRTYAEIEEFEKSLAIVVDEMECAPHEAMYRNTCHCKTWGRLCEYAPVCLHYDPNQDYIEFTRKETEYGTEED